MHGSNAVFVKGIRGTDPIATDGKRQFVFVGRSNVGKSSVINAILGRKDLVRSSSTPGQTRQINFFAIDENTYFIDFPGYGYAKISMKEREKLRRLILWYLERSGAKPNTVFLILDAQVGARPFDREMAMVLETQGHASAIIANKWDKMNQSEKHKSLRSIEEVFPNQVIIPFSAVSGIGKETVWNIING